MAEINLGKVVGSDATVTAENIEGALGYMPADEDIVGMLTNLTTDEKANLVSAINEVKSQYNEIVDVELPKKANKIQETSQVSTLVNGWVVYNSDPVNAFKYYKDSLGVVNLSGMVSGGGVTPGTTITTLPTNYAPEKEIIVGVLSRDGANRIMTEITISTDGRIRMWNGSNTYISFDGVSFKAGAI